MKPVNKAVFTSCKACYNPNSNLLRFKVNDMKLCNCLHSMTQARNSYHNKQTCSHSSYDVKHANQLARAFKIKGTTHSTHHELCDAPILIVAVIEYLYRDVSIIDWHCVVRPVMITFFTPLLNATC